ncbi:molybdopterin molybdotransferase MoeA [Mucilaginibacter segetis]|uniref:Molybdopterin molybdenumtransferase n=1 Tax=Mucilaginibacter segetis TaxID=2793071 RepID=A0A934PQS5_9SPHI|nr:molybdopterin molybdotransferase MoeA [Mucilaginibacter segetis]MBK0379039.1 molybdopterin molybdotransferase MoeA [Mucilaginibacter segetis]
MITVEEAEKIILARLRDYGTEKVPFEQSLGRVLAEDIKADRDLPPFNRVTMDGIAISFKAIANDISTFRIKATQAAGEEPLSVSGHEECIEIMTGAALSPALDTVIRYEDLTIKDKMATIAIRDIKKGQNVHTQGSDKKSGDIVAAANQLITPAIISLAASLGKTELLVKTNPRIAIISSGDELVDVADKPTAYQIRRSNNYTINAVLNKHGLQADMHHIPDEPQITRKQIDHCLHNYDVILLSGGISMGKFDYIPKALDDLQVVKLFHKVKQRPGKPFWFGSHANGTLVFAFPGNPVATFMCLHRYFLTWFRQTMGLPPAKPVYAVLSNDFSFQPDLDYFLQVKLNFTEQGSLTASPVEGNGSGDFANLADTDAFIALPAHKAEFKKGEVCSVLKF